MEWFENWFGADYDALYQNRNEEQSLSQVNSLCGFLKLPIGGKWLDLACGAGRHLKYLEAKGYSVVGSDLSLYLLQKLNWPGRVSPAIRADYRYLPFKEKSFDVVVSFFTSFGYLETREDNWILLKHWSKLIKKQGFFFLDHINQNVLCQNLPKTDSSQLESGSVRITQERYIDNHRVFKKIIIEKDFSETQVFWEKVYLFTPDELNKIMSEAGMKLVSIFGNENLEPFIPQSSPRMAMLWQKI